MNEVKGPEYNRYRGGEGLHFGFTPGEEPENDSSLLCEDQFVLACDLEFCIEARVGTLRTCFGSDLNTVWLPR